MTREARAGDLRLFGDIAHPISALRVECIVLSFLLVHSHKELFDRVDSSHDDGEGRAGVVRVHLRLPAKAVDRIYG